MRTDDKPARAALLLIGNELLTGKIVDQNGPHVIRSLRDIGVELGEIRVIADDVPRIAECIAELASRFDVLFTSGGVGPTHDDMTMLGVARAFEVALAEDTALVARIQEVFTDPEQIRVWRKMAQLPEGSELVTEPDMPWPVYKMRNVYVLPGIPEIFRRQFDAVKDRFAGRPVQLRVIYFTIGEGELTRPLSEACERFPEVGFGSYPLMNHEDYRTRVTLESTDAERVEAAGEWLRAQFEETAVHSVDRKGHVLR